MKTLTTSTKRRITEDWHSRFPTLSVYKPMWLLRRVGPMIVGICLNRDSGNDNYKPLSHVDCLCTPAFDHGVPVPRDYLTLTLKHQPRKPLANGQFGLKYVRVRAHEISWREQADLLECQAYVPLEGRITLEQVLDGYRRFLTRPNDALHYPHCYTDMVLLLAWAGRSDEAARMVVAACDEMTSWPSATLDRFGGLDGWRRQVSAAASDPAALQAKVDRQIITLGLKHVAAEEFM